MIMIIMCYYVDNIIPNVHMHSRYSINNITNIIFCYRVREYAV